MSTRSRFLDLMACLGLPALLAAGCSPSGTQKSDVQPNSPAAQRSEEVIDRRIRHLEAERADIDRFIAKEKTPYERTGSGMHYSVIERLSGTKPKPGDRVSVSCSMSLLDGKLLFSASELGVLRWAVEREEIEPIGLHEAVQLLGRGDSARFVLPSHLAYGISGSQGKVPMASAVVIDLRLLP